MAEKPPENHPWSTLSTANTFDKGNHSWMTRCVDDADNQVGGQIVGRVAPSTSLLIESLVQQLCTIFEGDALRRNKLYYAICDRLHAMKLIDGSYNKIEFESMRGQYQAALYNLVTVARALTGSDSPLQVPNCLIAEWSRYRREFIEISFIAAGGFGNVYKAQHRLDGNVYAVKKIIVRSGRVKTIMKHLEEVKTIARLNHTNIVSYKGAWIEKSLPETFLPSLPAHDNRTANETVSKSNTDDKITKSTSVNNDDNSNQYNDTSESVESRRSVSERSAENNSRNSTKNISIKNGVYSTRMIYKNTTDVGGSSGGYLVSHDIINERFQQLNSMKNLIGPRLSERISFTREGEELSDLISFRSQTGENKPVDDNGNFNRAREASVDEIERPDNTDESESCEEAASEQQLCTLEGSLSPRYATLYIQMGLCDQTLRQWLDEREEPTPIHVVTAIITQILSGLEYIHSLDIVHHDVKPSNIFVSKSGNLQVQLGDFGLACPLQRDGHHSVIGTLTYAAPEQLNGKCDPKSDVYSLGIILLELLLPMETCMERSRVIDALKKGQIPAAVTTNYPQWAQIIHRLVQDDPEKRFSPTELLKQLSEDKDSMIARLQEENLKKDDRIKELEDRIKQLKAMMEKH